jgi:hypothetical protein
MSDTAPGWAELLVARLGPDAPEEIPLAALPSLAKFPRAAGALVPPAPTEPEP